MYGLAGAGTVGDEGVPFGVGRLAVFGDGDVVTVTADREQELRSPNLEVLILGGAPIREPIAWVGRS